MAGARTPAIVDSRLRERTGGRCTCRRAWFAVWFLAVMAGFVSWRVTRTDGPGTVPRKMKLGWDRFRWQATSDPAENPVPSVRSRTWRTSRAPARTASSLSSNPLCGGVKPSMKDKISRPRGRARRCPGTAARRRSRIPQSGRETQARVPQLPGGRRVCGITGLTRI